MKDLFSKLLGEINTDYLMDNAEKLMKIERGQTFENYHKSAAFTLKLMQDSGLKNAEIINVPADGKTVYQDKRMPIGWKASKGKVTIIKSALPFDEQVVADYKKNPFHLVKGSVATPPGGLDVHIITETQLFAGEDARGALIMLNPFTWPRAKILTPALDLGAIGFISDFLVGRNDYPNAVQWVSACTEGSHWHVQAEDRPFINFSVSPSVGNEIRTAASAGRLTAHVECDGVRYNTELPAVTALIPGRQKKEVWVLSHLYEPLIDDNSSGVVSSIEIARVINELSASGKIPPLEFSLRLVFAAEMYGFAAFADKFKKAEVVGAINTDAMAIVKDAQATAVLAGPGTPFFGNFIMEKIANEYKDDKMLSLKKLADNGYYGDDCFLGDPDNAIPTVWFRGSGNTWHNSESDIKIADPSVFSRFTALNGTWIAAVITANEESLPELVIESVMYAKKHLQENAIGFLKKYSEGKFRIRENIAEEIRDYMEYRLKLESERVSDLGDIAPSPLIVKEIKKLKDETEKIISELQSQIKNIKSPAAAPKCDKWFDYAASIIPERAVIGFPYDLVNVPKVERTPLPGAMTYGPIARVFANMDGKKNLQRLLCETEWEEGKLLTGSEIKKYVTAVSYLTDYGYLKTTFKKSISKKDILKALKDTGIQKGDLVFVHSSLSAFGKIDGGPETIIDAIIESVGTDGTVLFPTFTTSFIYFDGTLNKSQSYRPFDKNNPANITVGKIPKVFLKRKNVFRSEHPTHSAAGVGPLAKEILSKHKETDSPTGETSPFSALLEKKGKILHFGSGLNATTFLHFLEDKMNLPGLGNAVCRVKNQDGSLHTVMQEKHLPGHRDFYDSTAESKFFKKAKTEGLVISEQLLGLGKVIVMETENLYKAALKVIKKDPNIFLCDSKECIFCSKNKR